MKNLLLGPAIAFGTILATLSAGSLQNAAPADSNTPVHTILCRALEVKTDPKTDVTVVLFHQASKADGPALSEMLKSNDGANIEFFTSDGKPHAATVFRLDTCFGRGLLVFSSATAHLNAREQFSIRVAVRG
ncbi:MAG: hypothetical protein ACLPND_13170 [Candidatus Korobacteraceae bacterium]